MEALLAPLYTIMTLSRVPDVQVNAALLAPETREMMIGYAEVVMSRGAPVKTYDELTKTMVGRWKLAFTTEDRYRALPPGTTPVDASVYLSLYQTCAKAPLSWLS